MGTDKKLSHRLIDNGFFCALGTTEKPAGNPTIVKRGEPCRFDTNNGVIVVNDEDGRPWIQRMESFTTEQHRAVFGEDFQYGVNPNNLKRGTYVPHSNDGGYFVINVLSAL